MNLLNPKWLRRQAYTCPHCNHDYTFLELPRLCSGRGKKNSALIRDIGLNVIFLSETKIPIKKCSKFLMSLGFYNLDSVEIHHSKYYLQRHFETCPIVSNITTICPRAVTSVEVQRMIEFHYLPENYTFSGRGVETKLSKLKQVDAINVKNVQDMIHVLNQ